jgi:hypothetical protein
MKKLCAACPGAGRWPQVSPFRRNPASLTAAAGHLARHFAGFSADPPRTGSSGQGTAPISPVEKIA